MHWSSCSAFDADQEVIVQILHWPNMNFSGHKKLISKAPLDQGVNWYPERSSDAEQFIHKGCRILLELFLICTI